MTLPTDYANLQIWVDTTQDSWNDNDAVNPWTDRSGATHDLVQLTPTNKPTFKTNIINGKPAMYFVTNDVMSNASPTVVLPTTAMSVFAVVRVSSFPTSDAVAENNGSVVGDSVGWTSLALSGASGGQAQAYIFSGSAKRLTVAITTATNYVLHWRHDGTDMFLSVDGGTEQSVACGTRGGTGGALFVGESYGGQFIDGYISELVIYSVALSTSDVAALNSYLYSKWVSTGTNATAGNALSAGAAL